MAAVQGRLRAHDWMSLTVSDLAFEAGDWVAAREHLVPSGAPLAGRQLIFRHLRAAELALGVGDEDAAGESLESIHDLVCDSSEPQWIALHGLLLGELCRRRHDYDGARDAVENALGRIELCTDDVMRIARVAAAGSRIEADRAQRARDLSEKGELREAMTRCKLHVARLEAAADEGGQVERAYLAEGKAELARARGRGAREWAKAVTAWEQVDRPYPVATSRWREAEAHVTAGDRAAAVPEARAALETADELGSEWLAAEVRALAERGRLNLGVDESSNGATAAVVEDPFGLTPRERQVLALVAQGATNRQIGAALFMAEKTASVHVSRILAKLGVQGRTQAAAIAHRQHLD
jgi:DNA-binding CsgD family transcriptional regulator